MRERMKAVTYENSLGERPEVNNVACKCWGRAGGHLVENMRPDVRGEPGPSCTCVCVRECGCAHLRFGRAHKHMCECVVCVNVCVCLHHRKRPLIPTKLAWTWTPWNCIKRIPREVGGFMFIQDRQNYCFLHEIIVRCICSFNGSYLISLSVSLMVTQHTTHKRAFPVQECILPCVTTSSYFISISRTWYN